MARLARAAGSCPRATAATFHQALVELTRGVAPGIVGAVDLRGARQSVVPSSARRLAGAERDRPPREGLHDLQGRLSSLAHGFRDLPELLTIQVKPRKLR